MWQKGSPPHLCSQYVVLSTWSKYRAQTVKTWVNHLVWKNKSLFVRLLQTWWIYLRDGFKTQPSVDRWVCLVPAISVVLNNGGHRTEPTINWWLDFEAVPKVIIFLIFFFLNQRSAYDRNMDWPNDNSNDIQNSDNCL